MLDLTPFGFTPTESNAYRALLELGPSSGYAVARSLSIARANAYQALDGLVTKGAAVVVGEATPRRYRPVQPTALFAGILAGESRKLDDLERQIATQPAVGLAPVLYLRGERALMDLAIRTIVRFEGEVRCVARRERLEGLGQAFRARVAGRRPTDVWTWDSAPADYPLPVGQAAWERTPGWPADDTLLLLADGALSATFGEEPEGVWSESRTFTWLVRGTIELAVSTI